MVQLDNFFKEKNEEFEINAPQAASGWQAMQQQMAKQKAQQRFKKVGVGAVAVIGVVALSYILFFNKKGTTQPTLANSTIPNTEAATSINTKSNSAETITTPTASVPENTTTANTTTKEIVTEAATDQTSFYIDLSKVPELFEFNANEEKTVTTKSGATIKIPANILSVNNTMVSGAITMTLQEYYNKDLHSAMLKYHFYQNDKLLKVKNESSIEVLLPKTEVGAQIKFYDDNNNMPDALLQKMQWASVDALSATVKQKVNYTITLPKGYSAKTFLSFLAFENQKMMVAGDIIGNSIVFKNIPKGESVYFTSLGKSNHKYFICNKKLTTSSNTITDLNFIETTENFYSKRYDELTKLTNPL